MQKQKVAKSQLEPGSSTFFEELLEFEIQILCCNGSRHALV